MIQQMILRIKHDGEPLCLYQFDTQSHTCDTIEINGWPDKELTNHLLIILVPASWVYHSKTKVASKNAELLTKSIPFAIEEELSNDVDDNYYAFRIDGDNSQAVVAIEKAYLEQLHQQIKQQNLKVQAIFSEADWLPAAPNLIHLWQDESSSLLRFGNDQSMRIANPQVSKVISVFGGDAEAIISNGLVETDQLDLPVQNDLSAHMCCEALSGAQSIDLYVDEIKTDNKQKDSNKWQSVKWLAAALVVSWLIIQGTQWYKLKSSITTLKQQQQNLLTQNYPDVVASELVDPFAAFQSRMKLQNASLGRQENLFVSALHGIGTTLQQQQAIRIRGLRLVERKIEIQITAPAMSSINVFHQALQQQASDFNVQVGVNELAEDNSFRSILTMVPQ